MPEAKACPYRNVELGRLFCTLATMEGERSTSQVFNETCDLCQMARIRKEHPCRHLNIGLDLGAHRNRTTIDNVRRACLVYKVELDEMLPDCSSTCPEWSEDESVKDLPEPPPPPSPEEPEAPPPAAEQPQS